MTDNRELLELAAKAIGVCPHFDVDSRKCARVHEDEEQEFELYCTRCGEYPHRWAPLEDDGDALRLAVKLQLTVCNEHILAGTTYCMQGEKVLAEESVSDPGDLRPSDYAATRLAIVRAAAEIGRQMENL